jgi:excinuclease ABC subunit C
MPDSGMSVDVCMNSENDYDPPAEGETAEEAVGRRAAAGRSLARGARIISETVERLPLTPGVYRMVDDAGTVLYVGKARSLKKRVANYANPDNLSHRLRRMVAETAALEVVVTHTEVEALLLESNLIKRFMPRYNVLLRDDKSFPHILLTGDHPFPQVTKHRGARTRKGEYFGPFASAGSVNKAIIALQRAFLLRNCTDAVFQSRTRPCLQHQIKRCSAPCVGRVSGPEYAELVEQARGFLAGRSREIQQGLVAEMQAASSALDFEAAARYRDRIRALTQIQAHQAINVDGVSDADVIAAHQAGGHSCIEIFFFRGGSNNGNRAYFPSHDRSLPVEEVLTAFVGQFYDDKPVPPLLLLSHKLPEAALLSEALTVKAGRRVTVTAPERGEKRTLVEQALTNAREALGRRLSESASQRALLDGVAALFGLEQAPERIEIYDNSHISGTNAQGAMVVAGPEGFNKGAYRRFNIRSTEAAPAPEAAAPAVGFAETQSELIPPITPGDDFGMMREVMRRRFGRALKEDPERSGPGWPDLLLIDGGLGQLNAVRGVLDELGLDDIVAVGVAKGPDRNAGRERFFLPGREPITLEPRDPVLYFLQRLRDEAHRFVIGGHRARRQKALGRSELDEIGGIGAARRKALLHHFGSVRAIARAGLSDLEQVAGVNKSVAKKIYEHFHPNG